MTEAPYDCPDCAATAGDFHDNGCDVARCTWTGQQRLACAALGEMLGQEEHDCGRDIWTGEWPGKAECREYGLWCYWPDGGPFIPCAPDHPEATEDLNALIVQCRWDREAQRWVRREAAIR